MVPPKFDIDTIFPAPLQEELAELHRLTEAEFKEKLKEWENAAKTFVNTYLKNRTEVLSQDNWNTLIEYYISWKAYSNIEQEDVSKDKKETLMELLKQFSGAESNNNENITENFDKKVLVF